MATTATRPAQPPTRNLLDEVRERHPGLRHALLADIRVRLLHLGEQREIRSRRDAVIQFLRLAWIGDGFLAQALYRVRAALRRRGVPLLPRLLHHLSVITGQVAIGDPVLIHPGVCILHGQVVIDGFVEIHSGTVIAPFTSIGLLSNDIAGPTIERNVRVGTGARVLGKLHIGENAVIGANAVVTRDVPADITVVGVPARPVGR
jgi:serine O-acetyltransferase